MEAHNYRRNGLFEDGILKCMAISVLFHVVVFLAALGASWLMPPRKLDLPLCTVSLLTMRDLGGGGEGKEGAMSKGDGKPPPAGGSEAFPPTPEPEAATVPEPKKTDAVDLAKVVKEETVSLIPVPKKVEKSVEKPKPKPKSVPELPRKPQAVAKAETPPPAAPSAHGEGSGSSGSTISGHGGGLGLPDGEGHGKGHSGEGEGAGAGSGVGAGGGGHGPFNAPFGSGDGPHFAVKVLPRYPRLARELGKEGTVLLLVTIDELGRLVHAEVVERAGSGFDEEALLAVKSSTFKPARRDGKPVLCKANLPILFQMR